ncbi:MAG: D-glycero-beta-D-manno-heptose-7-phosphate kinase [Desulfobacterales bacterium]|nr:D-glycero-beta-D-manno-heptose-7-phosphate kinase [Desulfobacterales bacterium]
MPIDIAALKNRRILVVGDLMVDEYLWGEVDRISPEAPVQVVVVREETATLGGAGNVVNNLIALGARVSVAGVVGTDHHGDLLRARFAELGVDVAGIIAEPGRATTRKKRVLAANQQMLRIDWETRAEISAHSLEAIQRVLAAQIPEADLVLISDYGKGLLTPGLIAEIVAAARRAGKAVIGDPKGRDYARYAGLTLLTPNQKEAGLAAGIEIRNPETLAAAAARILATAGLEKLLITCGKDGMVLFDPPKPPLQIRSQARQVFDVSGAGDTVVAVLGLAMAAGAAVAEAAALANAAAGIVVGKVGTATVSAEELAAAESPCPTDTRHKVKRIEELAALGRDLRRRRKRIVLTNGCFDFLHAGHLQLFSASRRLGDVLVVAIDDDASVRSLKGPGRPVIPARERVRILTNLDAVDFVVVFAAGELDRLIASLKPDILTKGSNYASGEVFGRETVEQNGGRVALIPVVDKTSATEFINHIKKDAPPQGAS